MRQCGVARRCSKLSITAARPGGFTTKGATRSSLPKSRTPSSGARMSSGLVIPCLGTPASPKHSDTSSGTTTMADKTKIQVVTTPTETTIQKPGAFDLNKFKSKSLASAESVETLLTALPHCSLSQARDFVRLHSDDAYWSDELCFVTVPI